MTNVTTSTQMSKMTGLLVAGGVFGAVAASALATSVAPAPAQALDACFSSGLTGTLKTGSASCSSSGPLQWAIAIGANTTAEVAGGLFNLAIAVGDNSEAYASRGAQSVRGGYFNIATAAAGGTARASDGVFQIANARGEGSGAFARYGSFGVARAIGVNAFPKPPQRANSPPSTSPLRAARIPRPLPCAASVTPVARSARTRARSPGTATATSPGPWEMGLLPRPAAIVPGPTKVPSTSPAWRDPAPTPAPAPAISTPPVRETSTSPP